MKKSEPASLTDVGDNVSPREERRSYRIQSGALNQNLNMKEQDKPKGRALYTLTSSLAKLFYGLTKGSRNVPN